MYPRADVLILVLVEHTLRVFRGKSYKEFLDSLNPCFSGTYSQSIDTLNKGEERTSLNPCFSGTYSQRDHKFILVSMGKVLILVLVEHTLRGLLISLLIGIFYRLNPCFSGTYSQSLLKGHITVTGTPS